MIELLLIDTPVISNTDFQPSTSKISYQQRPNTKGKKKQISSKISNRKLQDNESSKSKSNESTSENETEGELI